MKHDAEQRVRDRAYHIWEAEGRPHGRDHEFWERALKEEQGAAAPAAMPTPGNTDAAKPAKAKKAAASVPAAVPAKTATTKSKDPKSAKGGSPESKTASAPSGTKDKRRAATPA